MDNIIIEGSHCTTKGTLTDDTFAQSQYLETLNAIKQKKIMKGNSSWRMNKWELSYNWAAVSELVNY